GGEFSSDVLRDFCRGEGILQSFTLSASPQQNGIAECCMGLVMEVARTSMIHAAAPHFLWPFAVRYAARQLNLWPRVSLPKTLPTLPVPFYRLFLYRSAPPPPPPLFLAPGPTPPGGAESEGAGSGGAEPGGTEPGGAEPVGVEPGGADFEGAESRGAEPRSTASSGGPLGASPRLSSRP
ncbi:unnamed protein product, partial [Closterium sp. NIES-54]